MLGIVGRDSWIVLNALVVLNELRCDAIRQVRWHIVECSGSQLPDLHGDLEIRDGQAVVSEVPASVSFKPML